MFLLGMSSLHLPDLHSHGSSKPHRKLFCSTKQLSMKRNHFFSLNLFTAGSYHWQVPVSVSSSANPCESVARTLSDQKSCTLTISGVKPDQ